MSGQLFVTQDGSHSIYSEQFEVSYHSKYGAIQETQHVFINAGLLYKADQQKEIAILDIGFGTGLNAYMTLLESSKRGLEVSYSAYEAFPISSEQVLQLNYPQLLNLPNSDALFSQLHSTEWNEKITFPNGFNFIKHLASFQSIQSVNSYDLIYFDAFAPSAQPELWETTLLEKMYTALKNKGVLVTYCAKGQVKRNLKEVGFEVEKLKGPPGKREMTRAIKVGDR